MADAPGLTRARRTGRWRSAARRAAACVILGAIANVAVAWIIAAFLPLHGGLLHEFYLRGPLWSVGVDLTEVHRPGALRRAWSTDRSGFSPIGLQLSWDVRDGTPAPGLRPARSLGWGELDALIGPPTGPSQESVLEDDVRGMEDARGWPFLALWCTIEGEGVWLPQQPLRASGGIALTPADSAVSSADFRVLPYRPIWRGMALNTAIYAALIAIALFMPPLVRGAWRRRAGRCPGCGYPIHHAGPCPECGRPSALPRHAPGPHARVSPNPATSHPSEGSRPMATPTAPESRGLEGIVAGESAICSVEQGKLIYRGYEIHDLAEHATFEEVAYLLLVGQRPSSSELRFFKDELIANRALPGPVLDFIKSSGPMLAGGTAVPMDTLRTCVSILGNLDRDAQDNSPEANLRKAKRILAKVPAIIGHMQSVIDGRDLVSPETGGDAKLSHAGNLLYLMSGQRPTPEHEHVMDVSLILYAEHDFNASTFASRVIAATLSDMHGAMTGAIAALKGPLHGGANEAAMDMLKQIIDDEGYDGDIDGWMRRAFAEKRKLMGFGHRVYKNGDHRASILHRLGKELAARHRPEMVRLFTLGERVQDIMLREKKIHPNVDFPCGMTYYAMGIPVPQYTPIFVASRVTGWAAHIMEQHANNRLIRPLSVYTGPAEMPWRG